MLGLQRSAGETADPIEESNEQTITVILEKSPTGSLGLSLAKKTGYDGWFFGTLNGPSALFIFLVCISKVFSSIYGKSVPYFHHSYSYF